MAEVDPRRPSFCHLVEQVIPKKLQQVAVARLRPRRVLLKPDSHNKTSQPNNTTTSHILMDLNKMLLTLVAR